MSGVRSGAARQNIALQADDPNVAAAARRDDLKKRIADLKQVREERSKCGNLLFTSRERAAAIADEAAMLVGSSSPARDALDHYVQNLDDAILSADNQMKDAQTEHERRDRRTRDLEKEERFHTYQEKIAAIETILQEDIKGPRNALMEYDSFLATVEEVGRLALESFDREINSAIPPLAKDITRAYVRLTAHPSYDGIFILNHPSNPDRMEPGKLELRVTSSRCSGNFPTNVLNGQAARALQLVPYFVFSDYWRDVMELDLLLVDDPSESFDTSHLDHLMSVLHSVASHTQLVVASHESDRMRPLIDSYFPIEERCIICVKDFDPLRGPALEQQ